MLVFIFYRKFSILANPAIKLGQMFRKMDLEEVKIVTVIESYQSPKLKLLLVPNKQNSYI